MSLLGDQAGSWHRLEAEDIDRLQLPSHLRDQVFRVLVASTTQVPCFEFLVSQQFPKDAFDHLGHALRQLSLKVGLINVVHHHSARAHLVLWKASLGRFCHVEIDFSQPSQQTRQCMQWLRPITRDGFLALMHWATQQDTPWAFRAAVASHLDRLQLRDEVRYYAAVDLVLKLVFLLFVQHKGWLNFDPFYLQDKMAFYQARGLSILHCFLKPLFALLEGHRTPSAVPLGELPRLGGGLFEFRPEFLPNIPNPWFISLFDTLSSEFAFSLFESRSERQVLGVSPEVLGHVFENLLWKRDRRAQGVFFTPGHVAEKQARAAVETFLINQGVDPDCGLEVEAALDKVRIFDPACGSGTYLFHAYQALLSWRLRFSPETERYNGALYQLKRKIVETNLYGMDVHPMAVKLTEVRLWLNMIQDLEVHRPASAPCLPNLQHHLRLGDFLVNDWVEDRRTFNSWPKHDILDRLRRRFPQVDPERRAMHFSHIRCLEGELASFLDARRDRLSAACAEVTQMALPGVSQPGRTVVPRFQKTRTHPFSLHVVFSDVFKQGGFDMILGNPPWARSSVLEPGQRDRVLARLRASLGFSFDKSMDISLFFLLLACTWLRSGGHVGFLVPGKLLQARYARKVRQFLSQRMAMDYLFDYGIDQGFLFSADTFPLALGFSRSDRPRALRVERHGKRTHQSFKIPPQLLDDGSGVWRLCPVPAISRQRRSEWTRLGDLPVKIRRGVVTHAKNHFIFDPGSEAMSGLPSRPLLRGRDIQFRSARPGARIFWPFDNGPQWASTLRPEELAWLERVARSSSRKGLPQLRYGPRQIGPYGVIWRYMGREMAAALYKHPAWIPDQTTYYVRFKQAHQALALYVFLNTPFARDYLASIAERGKDNFFFFYAHTVSTLWVPETLLSCFEGWTMEEEILPPHRAAEFTLPAAVMP